MSVLVSGQDSWTDDMTIINPSLALRKWSVLKNIVPIILSEHSDLSWCGFSSCFLCSNIWRHWPKSIINLKPRLRSISFPCQRNECRNTAICWNHRNCSPSMKWLMVWLMHSHKKFSSLHGPYLQHSSLQLAVEFAPPWGNKKGCEQIRKRSSSICKKLFWWFFWSWCDDFLVVFWPVSMGPRTWLLRSCLGLWNAEWGNTWNS